MTSPRSGASGVAHLLSIWQIARLTAGRKRGSLWAFALAAAAFQYMLVASYPAIGGLTTITGVLQTFPPGLRRLLKIAPSLQAGFGLRDYLALGFFHPVLLGFGAACMVNRATDAVAGEIERGSIYLLLSRPIARWTLVVGKAVELVWAAGMVAFGSWLGIALGVLLTPLPESISLWPYGAVALGAWGLFAALGAAALVISSAGRRTGLVAGLGTAWTLIAFVLDVLPRSAESPLAVLNPWHHYDPQGLIASHQWSSMGIAIFVGWIVGGTALAALIVSRRDLA